MFTHLFKCVSLGDDESRDHEINERSPEMKLIIPPIFSGMGGVEIFNGPKCINLSFLTQKNKSNVQDISVKTLWNHAKDVETNCKKALALCLASNSPYKNFDGTFPSGTNWEDYLR